MARKNIVLDSWAMMAFFENESAAEQVEKIIIEAHQNDVPLSMSVVNVGELWYNTVRGHSQADAERVVQELDNLGIEVAEANWEITKQAAIFKTKGNLAYADCFAAALAKLSKAEIVTGDPEFKQIEGQVKILWV